MIDVAYSLGGVPAGRWLLVVNGVELAEVGVP